MGQGRERRKGCGCCGLLIVAFLATILWNLVVPSIWHGAPSLSFWQTLGLLLLIALAGAVWKWWQ